MAAKKVTSHPGFDALSIKGKAHPGFEKGAKHEERVNRGVPVAPAAPRRKPPMPMEADGPDTDMAGPGGAPC
jgi:hypothetical protein